MRILGNTFKEDANEFLKNGGLWICIGIAVIIIATIIVIFVIRNNKKKTIEDNNPQGTSDEWSNALGGKENVKEVSATGSRLTVQLIDKEKMNKDELNRLGVSNIMVMADKVILVIEDQAQKIASKIQGDIK